MQTRVIFSDSTEIRDPSSEAVVYIRTSKTGQPQAYGFKSAKTIKPDFNYRFRTEEQRAMYISNFFVECGKREQNKKAHKKVKAEKRATFVNTLAIGDILYASWGYEQTNVDYFQVINVTPKMVTFREIEAEQKETGFMCGDIIPKPDKFTKDSREYTRPVRQLSYDGSLFVPFAEYPGGYSKSLRPWDGLPKRNSWYG